MPQLPNDLASLWSAKSWIYGNPTDTTWPTSADAAIQAWVSAASRAILSYLQRPIVLPRAVAEVRSGTGGCRLLLREFPVLSITSLQIGVVTIPPRPPLSSTIQVTANNNPGLGYTLEAWPYAPAPPGAPQQISVSGYRFERGLDNVQIGYQAGYGVLNEVATAASSVAPAVLYGRWASDLGVAYANGTPLTAVTGAPSTGQYIAPTAFPSDPATPPTWAYQFAAGDAGQSVRLSYGYVPADLEYVCAKWVGEWSAYRSRPGQKSLAQPGGMGTAAFDLSDMPADLKMILQPYRRLVPVA